METPTLDINRAGILQRQIKVNGCRRRCNRQATGIYECAGSALCTLDRYAAYNSKCRVELVINYCVSCQDQGTSAGDTAVVFDCSKRSSKTRDTDITASRNDGLAGPKHSAIGT